MGPYFYVIGATFRCAAQQVERSRRQSSAVPGKSCDMLSRDACEAGHRLFQ
ncbi:hypothetical protein BRPE64_BCDS13660 [Caballeronia insecticola]|uniref:Uncharacterized protein n=1 Tax=Caballeronia insecticola TaxID=758793 RepID=R4X343_9BURK|nr:hypothetical protein BRPE64_BCDS13660 [Caballeronia insecticola]